jgi:hypothetical protein
MQIDNEKTGRPHSIAAGKSFWVLIQSRAFGACLALLSLFSIVLYVWNMKPIIAICRATGCGRWSGSMAIRF